MQKLIVVAFAALCLIGTSSLALAEDAMKGEMGTMKDEMKAEKDTMKGDMKAKKEEMKGKMKARKDAMKAKRHEMKEKMKAHKDAAKAPAAPAPMSAPTPAAAPYVFAVSSVVSMALGRSSLLRAVVCWEPVGMLPGVNETFRGFDSPS